MSKKHEAVAKLLASIGQDGPQTEAIKDAFDRLRAIGGMNSSGRSDERDDEAAEIFIGAIERVVFDVHRSALAAENSAFLLSEILMELRNGYRG